MNNNQGGRKMTCDEIKNMIREKGIDRRKIAAEIGVTPNYLAQILTGWAPLKGDTQQRIEAIIAKS